MKRGSCSSGSCSVNPDIEELKKAGEESPWNKTGIVRAVVSFVLLASGLLLTVIGADFFDNQRIRFMWYLAAYLPVGLPVMAEAWESMLERDFFSEFTLMSIATVGAFFIGEYPEAVAVMLFYAVGEIFQAAAVNRAKRNISALLDVRPETATVLREGRLQTVNPEQVLSGETVEVKVGERVPLDGILINESVSFNTSALTGESVPRSVKQGEEVLAGMIVMDKVSRVAVTKPFGQSAFARILEMVQDATERKAPTEQFIRKFSRVYTPVVVALAVLIVLLPWLWTFISPAFHYQFYDWIYRALVFLVISCPCALVISIPLGYFGGIGAASRQGILFKGSNYLEAITRINTVVMDKTGTLTQGVFDVQQIVPAYGTTEDYLLEIISAVETQSNHPIAKAIVRYAEERNIKLAVPENIKEIPGFGLEAEIDGKQVLVGNARLLSSRDIIFPAEIVSIPETIVLCSVHGEYKGYLLVADAPKEDAKAAIDELYKTGIANVVMLSGDKQAIVSKLAEELDISQAYGDLLPEGKVERLKELKANPRNQVAFVGDGINDAPVLALSDVGIAMDGLGSDVAVETADVVIQTDQPSKIPMAIRIGKTTRRIITQNISLALVVKFSVLILGALGLATLWGAVFADVGVSLIAILNAVRIMKKRF